MPMFVVCGDSATATSHSGMVSQGHMAIDSSGQETEKFSVFKPTILLTGVLAAVLSVVGTSCLVAKVLKKRKNQKVTRLPTAEKKKSGTTVSVRFATTGKFKAIPAAASSFSTKNCLTQYSSSTEQQSNQTDFAPSNFNRNTGLTELSGDFITVYPSLQGGTDSREVPGGVNTVKSNFKENLDLTEFAGTANR
eukprot:GHVT01013050.1.p1 GENE.GHVT01013050.1~~GHVT01013050.1.p1  ORF type:complete len:193 (-),score=25.08 GHVT01013050.1:1436-2014(-)